MNNNHLKVFLLSVTISGIFFCLISFLFSALGILSSGQTMETVSFGGLPIMIILSQFIVPAIGLWLYCVLNKRFPNNDPDKFSLSMSNLLLGICVAMLFFGYLKIYTLVTFSILFVSLLFIEYKNKLRFMYRFYRTYVTLLIPFYLCCFFIKTHALLIINNNATLKLNLINLPIEAYFYFMGILLITVYLFELFKSKELNTRG